MKKRSFLLLCAASLILIGCEKSSNADAPSKTAEQIEAEETVTISFYTNDSLLKYYDYQIIDSMHLEKAPITATPAPFDTLGQHRADWTYISYHIDTYVGLAPTENLRYETMKVIDVKMRLQSGQYRYCIVYSRNQLPFASDSIPLLNGYRCNYCYGENGQYKAELKKIWAEFNTDVNKFDQQLNSLNCRDARSVSINK